MARKKHKSLDAICEEVYNRNRLGNENVTNDRNEGVDANIETRRSGRVRRAPVLLDASPSPSKRRRKIYINGKRVNGQSEKRNRDRVKGCSTSKYVDSEDEEQLSSWKARLRSKGRTLGVKRKKDESPRGKKKLFEFYEVKEENQLEKEEVDGDVEGFDWGKPTVVRAKRTSRIKASNVSHEGVPEIEANDIKKVEEERIEVEVVGDVNEDRLDVGSGFDCENDREAGSGNMGQLFEEVEIEIHNSLQLDEVCVGNGKGETFEQIGKLKEQVVCIKECDIYRDSNEIGGMEREDFEGGSLYGKEPPTVMLDEKPSNQASADKLRKSRIKEGRRCGLCGVAADGKPPKRLAYDVAESENDACSGSSASEEPNYDICDGFGDEPCWLGRLLGPINDRFGIAGVWVHQHCAVWSPEVYFAGLGCLKNVRAALCRGRALKCSRCGRRGATIGCRVDRCPKTYHLPCARADGCIFDHRKFLIACTDHRYLFQPQGNLYLHRIKKMKAKKIRLEIRKMSNDAWRKDVEAEEKWLEGEDEEFLKRESKRLHRDILRIAPVYIGGPESESGKLFQGWESVAGLQDVIRCLKEVVILPLLYPDFFTNVGLTPPRGVLLHGYPGTGKTLVVRALIGACARGDKRIAYFARKGADCLGKYVGDAERQLRLLFQVAEKSQPSIIFFDEIDGLAPCRTRQQDQTHSSVVSTLLALMDGLKSRGSVVVIGATNRPEAVDPALRRPGRFDREIYFPLPSLEDRAAILSLHSQSWPKPVTGSLLHWIAVKTTDFAGADLQALCTQAAIIALKRNFPLHELLSAAENKACDGRRAPLPSFVVEERDWLEALSCAPPPCSHREAGMAANGVTSSPLPAHLISCLMQPFSRLLVSMYLDERLCLPAPLANAAKMIKNVIVTALGKKQVCSDFWWNRVEDLLQERDIAKEIERKFSCSGILVRDSTFNESGMLNDDADDGTDDFQYSRGHDNYGNSLLQNTLYPFRKNSGLRILIAGSPRSGQSHIVRCLLHYFAGSARIQKVDLATTTQEGRGDVVLGVTQIIMKCSSLASCVLFMPKIDLWAVNPIHQADKEDSECSSIANEESTKDLGPGHEKDIEKENVPYMNACDLVKDAAHEDDVNSVSYAWNSFMEQVDSISVSTSLMILATSEVPYQELPTKIRNFFNSDISKNSDSDGEYTFPRFSVQADGNFNRDTLIISSAAKLSRDVVQQFVQLVHHGTHNSKYLCEENKTCNQFRSETDDLCRDRDHGSPNRHMVNAKVSKDYSVKVPLPQNIGQLKGKSSKSSLQLAVSTLGYQILVYPHFAELCWVTSKLKEGPFSDVNGPWNGWPFNTCVIRPDNSLEPVVASSRSTTMKINKKSGVVRGLVAVGLLAYKGVYTSLTEVSFVIRKVLKLLFEKINGKIQAGKDKYQFVRILSQVAYLEDVVSSWAYTLQSLEQGIQLTVKDLQQNDAKSIDQSFSSDNRSCNENCKLDAPERSPHGLERQGENQGNVVVENNSYADSNNEIGGVSYHSSHVHLPNSFVATNELGCKTLNEKINTESANPSENNTAMKDVGSMKNSKEFSLTESATVRSEVIGNDAGFQHEGENYHFDMSKESTDRPVCVYNCCIQCIQTLNDLMQKNLKLEWEYGIVKTIEDVHDAVESASISLLSAVRRDYDTKLISDIIREMRKCDCQYEDKKLQVPMNCTCHPIGTSTDSQVGLNNKYIYRDGVLNPVDVEKDDVSSHCKFETLCLCSLINWMNEHVDKSSN